MAQTDLNNSPAEVKRETRVLIIALLCLIIATVALAIIGFFFLKSPDEIIEGQADATSVRISGKLPGRVTDIYVKEGDMVRAGDTLIHIHSSLAEAKLSQAEAMKNVAKAGEEKVDAGTRVQIIQSAEQLVAQAAAARQIAQKTYERMENLYKENVVSEQKRDEAKAAYDAALAGENAAKSQLSLAKSGAQREDKAAAASMVNVAQSGIAEVESLLEDQISCSPVRRTDRSDLSRGWRTREPWRTLDESAENQRQMGHIQCPRRPPDPVQARRESQGDDPGSRQERDRDGSLLYPRHGQLCHMACHQSYRSMGQPNI